MQFLLTPPYAIDGDQLTQEIEAATGIRLGPFDLTVYPPDQLSIQEYTDEDIVRNQEQIRAIIAAHLPQEEGTAHGRVRKGVRTNAEGAVGVHVDALTRQQLDTLTRCLLLKLGALDDTGNVRPLDEWL